MGYSNQLDILERIEQDTLVQLTDRTDSGAVDASVVASAIEDADALINSFISPVYQVPLNNVPRVIREQSVTITVYRLHLFRSIEPGVWKEAYKDALEFLQKIGERSVALEGVVIKPDISGASSTGIGFSSADRKFSRDNLKEW